jgi:hypothetical protein
VCDILTADLPRNVGCLDERRFLLVIPSSLNQGDRAALARNIFEEAGMDQAGDSVFCLCGLEAEFPHEARTRFARLSAGRRYGLTWAAAIAFWALSHLGLALAGLR